MRSFIGRAAALAVFFVASLSPAPPATAALQVTKLVATPSNSAAGFGVAVSASGSTAVVGAYNDSDIGAAYVFVRSNSGVWSQQQRLTADDAASGDYFGYAVSVEGDRIVVGAPFDDNDVGSDAGAAYVFTRSNGVWSQQQKLTGSSVVASARYGTTLAQTQTTVVVGSPGDSLDLALRPGALYVYTEGGSGWSLQARLEPDDLSAQSALGTAVGISGDSIIGGAPLAPYGSQGNAGAAYVFTRSGTTWTQEQKLVSSDPSPNDFFGFGVAVSGEDAIVGVPGDGGDFAGAAEVFSRSGGAWTDIQTLVDSLPSANAFFGLTLALAGDRAFVGAPFALGGGYVDEFARASGTWSLTTQYQPAELRSGDRFGGAIATTGSKTLIGAFAADPNGVADAGAAYLVEKAPPSMFLCASRNAAGKARFPLPNRAGRCASYETEFGWDPISSGSVVYACANRNKSGAARFPVPNRSGRCASYETQFAWNVGAAPSMWACANRNKAGMARMPLPNGPGRCASYETQFAWSE